MPGLRESSAKTGILYEGRAGCWMTTRMVMVV